jgi:hypothetical protein
MAVIRIIRAIIDVAGARGDERDPSIRVDVDAPGSMPRLPRAGREACSRAAK